MRTVLFAATILAHAVAQQPAFRAGVELVTVDVRVVGPDGQPITDLRAEDVVLKVDGKPRPIKSLNLLRVGVTSTPSGAREDAPPATSGTPRPNATGRTLILLFDHEHIQPGNERMATDAAIRAMDRLSAADQVALITIPNGRIEVNLTTDHEQVRRALRLIVGHYNVAADGIAPASGCVLTAMLDLLRGMQRLPGPKTFVYVSEGSGCGQAARTRMDNNRDLEDLATLSAGARAQFYVVQPNNAMAIDASRRLGSGMPAAEVAARDRAINMLEDLAGVTGGDLFRLSGAADGVFERVIRETAAYYELGFEPVESDRNGKDHTISVKVSRPKATVRARLSFAIPK